MRRIGRVVDAALLVAAIAALAVGVSVVAFDLHLQPVLSGSMRPSIEPGDLAVTRPVSARMLDPGDVIVFLPPQSTTPVMHRLTTVEREADGIWITTRGDANDAGDPWGRVRLGSDTAQRLVAVVPKAGYVPVWTRAARGPVLFGAGLLIGLSALIGARRKSGATRAARPAEGRFS